MGKLKKDTKLAFVTNHPLDKQEILSLKSIKDCNIIFVEIDSALFEDYTKIQTHSYITLATYYRLKLASLLPNTDRIIYFDCDMVINSSLRDLFNTDIDNYLVHYQAYKSRSATM